MDYVQVFEGAACKQTYDMKGGVEAVIAHHDRELIDELSRYKIALEKIARVNAMDYEYRRWAKEALDIEQGA